MEFYTIVRPFMAWLFTPWARKQHVGTTNPKMLAYFKDLIYPRRDSTVVGRQKRINSVDYALYTFLKTWEATGRSNSLNTCQAISWRHSFFTQQAG